MRRNRWRIVEIPLKTTKYGQDRCCWRRRSLIAACRLRSTANLLFDPFDVDAPIPVAVPATVPLRLGYAVGNSPSAKCAFFATSTIPRRSPTRRAIHTECQQAYGSVRTSIFVLGDNSPVSNDSRFWNEGPVVRGSMFLGRPFLVHLPGQVVPLKVFGRSVCWVPDPRQIRYIR